MLHNHPAQGYDQIMVTIKIDAGSLRASLKNLGKVSDEIFNKAAKESLRAAGADLQAGLLQNVKITDHSLQVLAAMDHPYARRHGSIRGLGHSKPDMVHKRSGRMSRNISGALLGKGNNFRYRVGFKYGVVPHAKFVVEGTRAVRGGNMLGRDVIRMTSQEPAVRKAMMQSIVRVMGKNFRTGAGIRFG
jgi:hypothetical protein